MVDIIVHLSVLSRIVENKIKAKNTSESNLEIDADIIYLR